VGQAGQRQLTAVCAKRESPRSTEGFLLCAVVLVIQPPANITLRVLNSDVDQIGLAG